MAESIQAFRGQTMVDQHFERAGGLRKSLVGVEVDDELPIVDLDDPVVLVSRRLRASHVAALRRRVTQRIAASIFEEGAGGLGWWSVLNADWPHVTLFHERALPRASLSVAPVWLSVRLPVVREAAALGIRC